MTLEADKAIDVAETSATTNAIDTIEHHESQVRTYCRGWPTSFQKARGCAVIAQDGREYLDFFAGAGALNYGHNPPAIKAKLIEYLLDDGIVHALDAVTGAKARFLERFNDVILAPRGMDYKIQFAGPTGTNTVEAALKLARKVTGRTGIVSFTNGYHGMTIGALATTGNRTKRAGAGMPLSGATSMPYDCFLGPDINTLDYLEAFLSGPSSGLDIPAAIILETMQAEGGVRPASFPWLTGLSEICKRHGILLIVDDIQVGCGRSGSFFSFEPAGITPDIVCLSKSISGFGSPMALTLIRPELDIWSPGEHNGTFRGYNPAFVTAAAALDEYWDDDGAFLNRVQVAGRALEQLGHDLSDEHEGVFSDVRGRGMLWGLETAKPEMAGAICHEAFERGLLMETAGPRDEVVKFLPPLIISDEQIATAGTILNQAITAAKANA
ncbi:MAG: diaminobutyrate-2-oxoglutarate transaminase [Hyphomicrobiaceae bacterium]|jgi:diaminobutyrate-2-oxoglutarate transaminase